MKRFYSCPILVNSAWLKQNLHKVAVLDATSDLKDQPEDIPPPPTLKQDLQNLYKWISRSSVSSNNTVQSQDSRYLYSKAHIPTAKYMDLDAFSNKFSDFQFMSPTSNHFGKHLERLGITKDTHVVVYDQGSLEYSARAYTLLNAFSIKTSVLDGGLGKWTRFYESETSEIPSFTSVSDQDPVFEPEFNVKSIAPFDDFLVQVSDFMTPHQITVLDARPSELFEGAVDTSPMIPVGHIPGAINVPAQSLINQETNLFKSAKEIVELLLSKNVTFNHPFVAVGTNSVDASVLCIALELIGIPKEKIRLFEGGMTEWLKKKSPTKQRLASRP